MKETVESKSLPRSLIRLIHHLLSGQGMEGSTTSGSFHAPPCLNGEFGGVGEEATLHERV
jgi:hypothetical protein